MISFSPRIMTIAEYYLPGYLAGGPVRTLANMAERLSDQHRFYIVARDRDQGAGAAYPDVRYGRWQTVGAARVRYLRPEDEAPWRLVRIVRSMQYDVLYLNSFVASIDIKVMLARRFGWLPRTPLVIAPRGEFNAQALAIKAGKKRTWLLLARLLGAWRDAVFQASSEHEAADIRTHLGPAVRVHVAMDLPPQPAPRSAPPPAKEPGRLRIVFLSRLARMKNLDGALRLLHDAPAGTIDFDIYGPQEDPCYWRECAELMADLPPHVTATYRGAVAGDSVGTVLSKYHVLLLPTHGENYGHVIAEALQAGCPVLISDRTPWRHLATAGVGADLPLAGPGPWLAELRRLLTLDSAGFAELSEKARVYGCTAAQCPEILAANRALFAQVLSPR